MTDAHVLRYCSRCGDMVSPDMKYACPEGGACPVFGEGGGRNVPTLGHHLAAPTSSPWTPKRPVAMGPYWIWDSLHPNFKVFAGWVSLRAPERGADLTLRTVEGHLLRPNDARYWWHPWQEETPKPPLEQVEPPPGTWSHRPWRSGAHRVMNRGTTTRADLIVSDGPADWREWPVTHGAFSLGRTVEEICQAFGDDALWFAYPDPPAPPDMT